MVKELFKLLLAIAILTILIPLLMLLFGEGALACKVFGWAFPKKEKQEIVIQKEEDDHDFVDFKNRKTKQMASVKHIFVDHNIYSEGKKGMTITVEYTTKKLKDADLYCLVRFYQEDGSPVKQERYNRDYLSVNGNVIVGDYAIPPYNDCKTRKTLFMPYDELPTHGEDRTEFILDASILYYYTETDYEVLDRSRTYSFCITNN